MSGISFNAGGILSFRKKITVLHNHNKAFILVLLSILFIPRLFKRDMGINLLCVTNAKTSRHIIKAFMENAITLSTSVPAGYTSLSWSSYFWNTAKRKTFKLTSCSADEYEWKRSSAKLLQRSRKMARENPRAFRPGQLQCILGLLNRRWVSMQKQKNTVYTVKSFKYIM